MMAANSKATATPAAGAMAASCTVCTGIGLPDKGLIATPQAVVSFNAQHMHFAHGDCLLMLGMMVKRNLHNHAVFKQCKWQNELIIPAWNMIFGLALLAVDAHGHVEDRAVGTASSGEED